IKMTSTEGRDTDIPLLVVCIFVLTLGVMVNLLIAAVNFPDWLRGRKIKASEKIQCVLSLSRMCYACFSWIRLFIRLSGEDNLFLINTILSVILIINNHASLWYLTLLSVFLFLKIADYKHAIFLRMKVLITQRVMKCLVGISLIAICFAPIHIWNYFRLFDNLQPWNRTHETCQSQYDYGFIFFIVLWNCGPFIPYSVCYIMVVILVCRHVKQMRRSDVGLSRSNLDSYYFAVKSLTVCYLIYGFHVAVNNLITLYYFCLGIPVFYLLLNLFPTLHSIYLIYRNPKLRHLLSKTIQQAVIYFTKRGDVASIETRKETTIAE
uniref:Taste receptor type 2 n=1 Tax=Leptobrachium leishanense TaxID=445787 RepID=A0A8C5PCW6_9ANUR